MRRRTTDAFFLILLLAAVVRLAGIGDFPPGLWLDEGLNGVDAWYTLHEGRPDGKSGPQLVYPDVFPREPLFVWILSIALRLGGPRVIVMRLTVAFLGALACGVFFAAVHQTERTALRDPESPEKPSSALSLALAAAFVLATMHWHAHFSRLVFRTNLVPLVACAAIWMIALAARTQPGTPQRAWRWLFAGAIAGVGFYTYLAWYFFLPVLAFWLWAMGAFRKPGVNGTRGALLPIFYVTLGVAIIVLPLAIDYIAHPGHLTGRPSEVSPLRNGIGPAIRLVARNLRDVALMFFWRGDHVPKHNVPLSPALGPLWALLFAAGLIRGAVSIVRRPTGWQNPAGWLIWLICMSMPSVLSQTDSANTLRNLGAAPAAAWFVASGWQGLSLAARRLPHARKRWLLIGLLGLLLGGGIWEVDKLWRRHPNVPGIAQSFNVLHVELARLCRQDPDATVFVPTDFYYHKTFEFLTLRASNIRPLDARALDTSESPPRDHLVLCTALSRNYAVLKDTYPALTVERDKLAIGGQVFAWLCRIPAQSLGKGKEPPALATER